MISGIIKVKVSVIIRAERISEKRDLIIVLLAIIFGQRWKIKTNSPSHRSEHSLTPLLEIMHCTRNLQKPNCNACALLAVKTLCEINTENLVCMP